MRKNRVDNKFVVQWIAFQAPRVKWCKNRRPHKWGKSQSGRIQPPHRTVRRTDHSVAQACKQANAQSAERTQEQCEQSKTERQRIEQLKKELLRNDTALAEAATLNILRKKPRRSEGSRGRLTGTPERILAKAPIEETVGNGSCLPPAGAELDNSLRAYQCWTHDVSAGMEDVARRRGVGHWPTSSAMPSKRKFLRWLAVQNLPSNCQARSSRR